ncbi:energy transducer TonB [Pseudomonas oryzihabitans]|uniref:energy transducer TonB n=1 Tax=Pseudomonas oryzihabitans TaxID=47885 RepID=UPI00285F8185|nr:energy transducer TonB [Pseudomonas psychrotolerans]MDR6677610.1 protein TonB [Pseudomonas psychrotolerans]
MANLQAARAAPAWPATPPESGAAVVSVSPLALAQFTHDQRPRPTLKRPEVLGLLALAVALHGAVFYWLARQPEPVLPEVPPQIPPMTIEFAAPPAPPVVDTPPPVPPPPPPEPVVQAPEPPPPVVDELAAKPAPPPKPKPVIKHPPRPKPQPVAKQATPPAPLPQAVAPAPQPTPPEPTPAPVKETPPSATAGYLHNPAPEYPALALRRNWEGTVLLRVRVLPNGRPGDIQIQQSAGRSQLDEAAVAAVRRWSFVPAKKGDQAIEGWVTVPIDFKIR